MTRETAKQTIREQSDEISALQTAILYGKGDKQALIAKFQRINAPRVELIERFGLQTFAAGLTARD